MSLAEFFTLEPGAEEAISYRMVGNRLKERTLEIGDAHYFSIRIPHRFRNPFDAVCEVVSANAPPSF